MASLREGWEKIRQWLDDDTEIEISEKIREARANRSESEVFMQKLLLAVEEELKNEIVRVPNTNKTYVPEKFVVYLSDDIDRNLRKDKREFFENGLSVMIFERATELAGNLELTTDKINVKIAVNPALENEIEVRADTANTLKTVKDFIPPVDEYATVKDDGTIEDFEALVDILYWVEIWQAGKKLNAFPIIQRKNTIGREDGENAANLRLPTSNRKISRRHAEISLDENDEIWVTALHKNPTHVAGQALRNGEKAKLGDDGEIQIYDFTLKLKDKR